MEPLQIVLIVLAVVGIWAVVELALVLRRARSTVDTLDRTVSSVNETIEVAKPVIAHLDETLTETKPVIEKLDAALEDVQPAFSQVEPLLKQGSIAIEALSADLIEVNGVLRDVSSVTGSMSSASDAVSGLANAASERVQRLFKGRPEPNPTGEHTLEEPHQEAPEPEAEPEPDEPAAEEAPEKPAARQYYTYGEVVQTAHTAKEESDE